MSLSSYCYVTFGKTLNLHELAFFLFSKINSFLAVRVLAAARGLFSCGAQTP